MLSPQYFFQTPECVFWPFDPCVNSVTQATWLIPPGYSMMLQYHTLWGKTSSLCNYSTDSIVIFILLPSMLLVLYSFCCFQNLFPFCWYILHTFLDSFYGSYKDGTEPGTCDCRWFASVFFASRFFMMFAGAYLENAWYFPIVAMIMTMVAILFLTIQPFKETASGFTTIIAFFMLLMALMYTCMIGDTETTFKNKALYPLFCLVTTITALLPLLYISAVVLHWMYSQRKFGINIMARFQAWKNGYDMIH